MGSTHPQYSPRAHVTLRRVAIQDLAVDLGPSGRRDRTAIGQWTMVIAAAAAAVLWFLIRS